MQIFVSSWNFHPSPNQCIIPNETSLRHETLACARVAGKAMDAMRNFYDEMRLQVVSNMICHANGCQQQVSTVWPSCCTRFPLHRMLELCKSPKKTQVFLELWRYSGAELVSYLLVKKTQLTSGSMFTERSVKAPLPFLCSSYGSLWANMQPEKPDPWIWWNHHPRAVLESDSLMLMGLSAPQKMWKQQETGTSH